MKITRLFLIPLFTLFFNLHGMEYNGNHTTVLVLPYKTTRQNNKIKTSILLNKYDNQFWTFGTNLPKSSSDLDIKKTASAIYKRIYENKKLPNIIAQSFISNGLNLAVFFIKAQIQVYPKVGTFVDINNIYAGKIPELDPILLSIMQIPEVKKILEKIIHLNSMALLAQEINEEKQKKGELLSPEPINATPTKNLVPYHKYDITIFQ